VKDQLTGANRGFGFVTYYNEQVARKLINEIKNVDINGKRVDLRSAEPKLSEKIAHLNKQVQQDQ